MNEKDMSFMTVPELIETIRRAADELETRCMESAGEQQRMICEATGRTCCWCRPVCPDRKPAEDY